ncbi:MAG: YdiU family protein [Gammaproteobacteria bacterium]|nr:YdiU family protein [Gammaproteobacteria bacterium]MCW8972247.1 YdiU family protein [Gammaproteobacteria bacterium]MCW8993863.1 YdiU family protein [Gammaproteobacteria bacterium]
MNKLEQLTFSNSFARRLDEHYFARLDPTPLAGSHLVAFNPQAAELIELDPDEAQRPEFLCWFGGEALHPEAEPVAMLYAGHQFGHYVPQLGDGRAILLGEVRNSRGERWELQLKGAGITPFSRRGDGRAVLRSTVREYLCSEAMHALGIPTTRALCMSGSEEEVYRERIEKGAMLLRMAPSHLRFGSFELFYYRNQFERLKPLADYLIEHHYPELLEQEERYLALFREVTRRTAELISQWQQVGFAHGVMNTDNMSILGLTLDYGPFGFLDDYDPGFICNHSDHGGRYAFDAQPQIGLWNLSCLGQALLPLFDGEPEEAAEKANAVLSEYKPALDRHYAEGMRAKLGLQQVAENDVMLLRDLLKLMQQSAVDYTRFFRALGGFDESPNATNDQLRDHFIDREAFDSWASRYAIRLGQEGVSAEERKAAMNRHNPKYILRNYLAQQAIDRAEAGDYSEIGKLHTILQRPFDEQPEHEAYAEPPPDWGKTLEISCSS